MANNSIFKAITATGMTAFMLLSGAVGAEEDAGFQRHAIAAPSGQAGWGGIHAARGMEGRREILIKLWAGAGEANRKTLLIVDAETGKSTNIEPPDGVRGEGSFGTFLSRKGRFYDMMAKGAVTSFYEFDVATRQWTAKVPISLEGSFRFAFSFTESDSGMIYAAIITEGGGLLGFDPETRKLTNFGKLVDSDWLVYPHVISDSAGWLYVATAHKEANIISYSPKMERTVGKVAEISGTVGSVQVFRAENGRAYINFDRDENLWYEAYEGKISRTQKPSLPVTLHQRGWRNWTDFGDGSRLESVYVSSRTAKVVDADGEKRSIHFDYESPGVPTYSLCAGQDGKVYGSTGIPLRFFCYDPASGKSIDYGLADFGGHINDLVSVGDSIYGAIYSSGGIIEIKPKEAWNDAPLAATGNPCQIYSQPKGSDQISRPFVTALHRGGGHLLVGGNPYRVNAGGGLVIYDLKTWQADLLGNADLIPGQGVKSVTSLEDGTVIGGSTVAAGYGGKDHEAGAHLFVLDWEKRTVSRRISLGRKTKEVADLLSPDGKLVVGVVEGEESELFWFSGDKINKIKRVSLKGIGAIAGAQSRRVLSVGPDGAIYLLLRKGIARFDAKSGTLQKVADSPVAINTGSAWVEGRLYFTSGAEIWSWKPKGS